MLRRCLLVAGLVAAAACDANNLSPAQNTNVIDTITLGALSRAPLSVPSGYDVADGFAVRTDQTSAFDFIFDIDSAGRHIFLPTAAIPHFPSASVNPGFQKQTIPFASVTSAPGDPWISTDTIVAAAGDVYAVRSRIACYLGVPEYGKIHVLAFDDVAHTVSLEVLANTNCGYKNLQPGIPEN